MGFRLRFAAIVFLCIHSGNAQITNVAQCLDVELTSTVLGAMPSFDGTSPQLAFMGFVKGTLNGNYEEFLWHLSDDQRIENCGFSDLSNLTPAMTNNFFDTIASMGFSNHYIRAYSECPTNGGYAVSATMQSRKGPMVKLSNMDLNLVLTNGVWRIVSWEVEE